MITRTFTNPGAICAVACCAAGITSGAANASIIYGHSVVNASQGLQKNGQAVSNDRSNPNNALGAPQNNDSINFYALGFGGSITISFGVDFTDRVWITETTYGNPSSYPEAAEIFVGVGGAWNTASYYSLGVLQNVNDTAPISLSAANALSGVSAYQFLRIEDRSNPALHSGSADGFDVDGVASIAVPAPMTAGVLALALPVAGWRRRRT
ncbi:MAG: hypothetical protein AB7G17_04715 [Phycisphaerales bacterium]